MARRATLNVFGLSMLDTITCGLGGGIVLLLALASLAKPLAEVGYSQAAEGKSIQESASNLEEAKATPKRRIALAGVYVDFQTPVQGEITIASCDGKVVSEDIHLASQSGADPAITHDNSGRLGAVVWYEGSTQLEAPDCVELRLPPHHAEACSYAVVGDAHAILNQARDPCPSFIRLIRNNNLYTLGLVG
jgi:hypothetical protein